VLFRAQPQRRTTDAYAPTVRGGRIAKLGQALAVVAVGACAAAWLIGRVLSDRYSWSQPISWIPTPFLAVPIWMALVGAATRELQRRAVVKPLEGRGPLASFLAPAGGVALLVLTGATAWHMAFVELGLHRAATTGGPEGPGAAVRDGGEATRIVFWNQASADVGPIAPAFLAVEPTVLVLANRHSRTATRDLAQAFIDTGDAYAAVGWPFDLFARLPVRRWASTSLELDGRSRQRDGSLREDPGWAAFYQLDAGAGTLTIWVIDLPSDPRASRMSLARRAGGAIASWQGATRVIHPDEGQWIERSDALGFPTPDVIVGDFNIPRGSASLRVFLESAGAAGMRDAFEEAGWGWKRTWPRQFPAWAIDQCFVGARVGAARFQTLDPGFGGHRALVVEVQGP